MDALEQENLIKRAINGDGEAFAEILEAHYDMIFRIAYKWCGNRADAEDVTQDVCVKLAGALRSFRMDSAFSSWLYRVTLNTAKDMHRKKKPTSDIDDYAEVISGNDKNAEQELAEKELWKKVQTLPDKQREAIILVYAEELSHSEVADIMVCAESTISWYIHEAKNKLKQMVQ